MALNTVRFNSKMKLAQIVSALNQNFQKMENSDRQQILKDDTGTPRIIIGLLPDKTFGIVISKPGINVQDLYNG